jgi:tetratricopeptide (TPR) repeat protein/O-antigen ligase
LAAYDQYPSSRFYGNVSAQTGPLQGEIERQPGVVGTVRPGAARSLAEIAAQRVVAAEVWLLPIAAIVLLTSPNPLVWPAVVVGLAPLAARLVLTGRCWRPTMFDTPLLLLTFGALLGGYASLDHQGSMVRLTGLLGALLLFVAVREHAAGERRLRLLLIGVLVTTLLACITLLVLAAPFLRLDALTGLPVLVSAIDRWQLGVWFVDQDWLLQRYRFRGSGVGALAVIGLVCVAAVQAGVSRPREALLALLPAPCFVLTLAVADNRGSILAAALTLGMMATLWHRRLLMLVPIGALGALLLLAFGPNDRGLSLHTLVERFWFWQNSLYLARELPLTGAGLGLESVQLVYRAYFQPSYPPFSHAHNIYLQGLLEYGAFGLTGLVGLTLATLWTGWRSPRVANRWTFAARLAGFGVIMAMLTAGLTEIVMMSTIGSAMALGACGLLAAASTSRTEGVPSTVTTAPGGEDRAECQPTRRALRWRIAVGGALALGVLLAISGFGPRIGARLLLNFGAADLNRAAYSETIDPRDRAAALARSVSMLRAATDLDSNDPAIQRSLALALDASGDSRRGRAAANRAKTLTVDTDQFEQFQLGRAYTEVSAWSDAIEAWRTAKAVPQLLQLGNRLVRARNTNQAVNAFVAAAQIDPHSHGAYDGVVDAARQRELTVDETIQLLDPLLAEGSPTEYGAHLEAARVYREAGLLYRAGLELKLAERLYGDDDFRLETGHLLLQAGLAYAAEPVLSEVTQDLPYEPEGWLLLARAQRSLGRPEDAVQTIHKGLSKVDPSGQFAPAAPRLPETAAVRAIEIKRSERAPLLGVLGESLTDLGRPAEALVALDEAVAAKPGDPSLQATRQATQDALGGAPINLLLNPDFSSDESWTLRSPPWWQAPVLETLPYRAPAIQDGVARVDYAHGDEHILLQQIYGLTEGVQYRVTARVRGERLGSGAATLAFYSPPSGPAPVAIRSAAATDWMTVVLDVIAPTDVARTAYVAVGVTPDTLSGAVVWVDEITLVRVDSPNRP